MEMPLQQMYSITRFFVSHTGKAEPCTAHPQAEPGSELKVVVINLRCFE